MNRLGIPILEPAAFAGFPKASRKTAGTLGVCPVAAGVAVPKTTLALTLTPVWTLNF